MGRLSEYDASDRAFIDPFASLISGAHSACLIRDASPYVGAHRSNVAGIASAYVIGRAL